jgi:hypothetical protein
VALGLELLRSLLRDTCGWWGFRIALPPSPLLGFVQSEFDPIPHAGHGRFRCLRDFHGMGRVVGINIADNVRQGQACLRMDQVDVRIPEMFVHLGGLRQAMKGRGDHVLDEGDDVWVEFASLGTVGFEVLKRKISKPVCRRSGGGRRGGIICCSRCSSLCIKSGADRADRMAQCEPIDGIRLSRSMGRILTIGADLAHEVREALIIDRVPLAPVPASLLKLPTPHNPLTF